jgi:putative ABC transport system permease protein
VYMTYDYLSRRINERGQVNEILIATEQKDQSFIVDVADVIEECFDSTNLRISSTRTHQDARHSLENAFDIVLGLLQLMNLEFAIVGALSLMSMMSLNVLERTREMGVLRVVGGGRKVISQIVVTEGISTGILSWFLGVVLSYPLGNYLGNVLGLTLINLPLTNTLPLKGGLIWFFTVIVLSISASLLPARNASRLSVRETLAYE